MDVVTPTPTPSDRHVSGSTALEAVSTLLHRYLTYGSDGDPALAYLWGPGLGFVCMIEAPSKVAGFAPSMRGK